MTGGSLTESKAALSLADTDGMLAKFLPLYVNIKEAVFFITDMLFKSVPSWTVDPM